jgi:hypothetical protein
MGANASLLWAKEQGERKAEWNWGGLESQRRKEWREGMGKEAWAWLSPSSHSL